MNHAEKLQRIDQLMASPDVRELESLAAEVEAYEKETYPIPPPTLQEAIKFRCEQMGESVLACAVGSAAAIGARLVMDITPMRELFQTMPQEEIVRFDTRQLTPEQWQITFHPLPVIE